MQSKKKYLKNLITPIIRVFNISLIVIIIWVSRFWGEQKSSLDDSSFYIKGSTVLSPDYYIQYLTKSFDGEPYLYDSNILLINCINIHS